MTWETRNTREITLSYTSLSIHRRSRFGQGASATARPLAKPVAGGYSISQSHGVAAPAVARREQSTDDMADGAVKHDYHLVNPSAWPLIGSISATVLALGLVVGLR